MQIIYFLSVMARNLTFNESAVFTFYVTYSLHLLGVAQVKIAVDNTLCGSRCNMQNCKRADAVPFITQIKDGRQFTC